MLPWQLEYSRSSFWAPGVGEMGTPKRSSSPPPPFRKRSGLRLPPEQPSDDGAEELSRRAAAVVDGRWHNEFYAVREPPGKSLRSPSGLRLLGSGGRVRRVHQCRLAVDFSFSVEGHPYLYGHLDGRIVCRIDQTDQAR